MCLLSQDAINALTNQNSELKSQLLRDVSNNNFRNDADSSSQVMNAPCSNHSFNGQDCYYTVQVYYIIVNDDSFEINV